MNHTGLISSLMIFNSIESLIRIIKKFNEGGAIDFSGKNIDLK